MDDLRTMQFSYSACMYDYLNVYNFYNWHLKHIFHLLSSVYLSSWEYMRLALINTD